jgi:trans-aconitate methyltransferase
MTGSDHWNRVYGEKAHEDVSWFQQRPSVSLAAIDRHVEGNKCAFIDIGGGASLLVNHLAERGWKDLTILDISGSALAVAKQRLGERAAIVEWIVADITRWRPERGYDVWHDRAVFHFLTQRDQRDAYRNALQSGTHPGSIVIMATFAPDGPEKCSGLIVERYDSRALASELGSSFELLEDWREMHQTPWGSGQSFNWCVFRRA